MTPYPAYKPTNIDWIGEIPEHWISKKLKYFAKIMNGKDYQEYVLEEEGYPVFGTGGVFARCSKFLHDKPSVLLGRKGSVENPQYTEEPFWTSDTTYYTDIFENTDPKFLFHLVKQINFGLYIYGSAIPSMTKSVYDEMVFPYPPLTEQQAIVTYLDQKTTLIDELIAKKEKKIELLKENRTSLINHAVTKGLDPNVKLKPSGIEWIGDIPEHWNLTKVKFISTIFGRIGYRGYTVEDIVDEGSGAVTISPSNIKGDIFTLESFTSISWEKYKESPEIMVFENDIILVKTGSTIGKTAIIPKDCPEMTINPQLIVLKNIKINNRYFYYQTTCTYFKDSFFVEQTGSTTPTISQEKVNLFPILQIPTIEEQQQIVTYLDTQTNLIDQTINLEMQKIEKLKEYRQSLISNVVTGKVCVLADA
jgi:type I restriction enzyme, S subunit